MPVFFGACRWFFQEVKMLVFRRHLDLLDGEEVIIHSLASDDISGNMLQLDSGGGGGGERLSWDSTGPVRRLTFVWMVVQLTLLAGSSTETAEGFAGVPGGKIPGLAFTNRRTRVHTTAGRVCNLSKS